MFKPRRTLAAALLAVTLSPLVVLASGGQADAAVASCPITPASVNLGTKTAIVTFNVPSHKNDWLIDIEDLKLGAYDMKSVGKITAIGITAKDYKNTDAGLHQALVVYANGASDCPATFRLTRASSLALKVTHQAPYRVLTGRLERVSFGKKPAYGSFAGVKVSLQYLTTAKTWKTARTVTTAKNGTYSAKIKLGKHSWRAVYAGSSTTGNRTSATHAG